MQLMDVVTSYLYGPLDSDIYMKVPNGIPIPNPKASCATYCVKLNKLLYGLKQSGRTWNNRMSEFLLQKGYTNSDDCPCVFLKKFQTEFCIICVYVDDLNIIGNPQDINETRNHLKTEFKMKDLGQTKFFLGLQIEHLHSGILVHQSAYIQKSLENSHGCSISREKDPFKPRDDDEEILGPEVPYLSVIGALMYLANCTRPDIAFVVSLLARYSAAPTKRHWT
jgi:hypothetical protein